MRLTKNQTQQLYKAWFDLKHRKWLPKLQKRDAAIDSRDLKKSERKWKRKRRLLYCIKMRQAFLHNTYTTWNKIKLNIPKYGRDIRKSYAHDKKPRRRAN